MSASDFPTYDERPPSPRRAMWLRCSIAAVVIVALSGATTAVLATNKIKEIAKEVFPSANKITVGQNVVTQQVYSGKPQTFLVLGSDRRSKAKNSFERGEPHSDTLLLVRFDPQQDQTSVLSIPRDLMVNIRTPEGAYYPNEKINAAYP